jgi:hypothetical protein
MKRELAKKHDLKKAGHTAVNALAVLSAVIAAVFLFICLTNIAPASRDESAFGSVVFASSDEAEPQPTQVPENNGNSGSGRYFITNTHIIISLVVAFALAVLIAVLQARKKFK